MRLKNDKRLRDRFMVPESYTHPAKGHLGLWEAIIQKYTQPEDTILDPMAGVGSTLLAALMGRNVVCVELETHFVELLVANWEKMRQHPMLGCEMGQVAILQGDARALPLPDGDGVEAIITSPPYEGSVEETKAGTSRGIRTRFFGTETSAGRQGYGDGYTRPSAIITSPPYEGVADERKNTNTNDAARGYPPQPMRYTRPDAIVSSPPFVGQMIDPHARKRSIDQTKWADGRMLAPPHSQVHLDHNYGTTENIGNLRSEKYWEAMKLVYSECYSILRDGGIMVLVLKGFTRDGKYIDLPQQTREEVESLGFRLFDKWKRQLWSLSFWRILQKRRDPAAFDARLNFEEILAFRKG